MIGSFEWKFLLPILFLLYIVLLLLVTVNKSIKLATHGKLNDSDCIFTIYRKPRLYFAIDSIDVTSDNSVLTIGKLEVIYELNIYYSQFHLKVPILKLNWLNSAYITHREISDVRHPAHLWTWSVHSHKSSDIVHCCLQ